jgi:hypothetical protein
MKQAGHYAVRLRRAVLLFRPAKGNGFERLRRAVLLFRPAKGNGFERLRRAVLLFRQANVSFVAGLVGFGYFVIGQG